MFFLFHNFLTSFSSSFDKNNSQFKQTFFLDNSKKYCSDRIKLLEKTHDENAHFQGKSVQITIAFRIDLLLS